MSKNRKLQIFVSSTYKDLLEERQAAVEAILESGHIPAGMELFAAGDKSQLETIKKWIDSSDIYLLVLGVRYGSIEPETGLSYIEVEYDYASRSGKPLFAVVIREDEIKNRLEKLNKDLLKINHADKLSTFRALVLSKTSEFFSDSKDVKIAIHKSINELIEEREFVGWIRGEYAKTEEELQKTIDMQEYISNLEKELSELKKTINIDTSQLSQGNDIVELDFRIKNFINNESITWDEIFIVIARQCLKGRGNASVEHNIKEAIAEFVGKKIQLHNLSAILEDAQFQTNYQTIKIQFIALDYFTIDTKTYTEKNMIGDFWNLTPRGKKHLTNLTAIKKTV